MSKPFTQPVNKRKSAGSSISGIVGNYAKEIGDVSDIKDIITFLEAPWGLNLNQNSQPLLPGQKFVLKAYYKLPLEEKEKTIIIRDKFNEREFYKFTEQEYLNYLYDQGRCNIQYLDDKPRNELVLIIGRRGTKSSMASWIAAYESYKLLKTYHPQKYYNMLSDAEIHLTCIATAEDQANLMFRQILGHFSQCEYFHRYMNKPTADKVYIRSRRDLEKYGEEGKASIVVKSAPCSARALRGAGNILVIQDEQAHFVDEVTQSNKSDKAVYDAMTPSVAQFGMDGKIINISSPLNKSGVLWDLYNKALSGSENILMIQAPTWEINNTIHSNFLKGRYQADPIVYDCEFGAQFSDRVKSWIPEEYLRKVIHPTLSAKPFGKSKTPHFMGLDIGFKDDGTAIAISHVESVRDEVTGELVDKIELDFVESRYPGEPPYENLDVLDFELLSEWIKELCDRFYIAKGLIDQHSGIMVAQNLARKGLQQFDLVYHTRQFNSDLYQNFMMLCIDQKVRLYNDKPSENEDSELIDELLKLQVHQFSKNVISVEAPKIKGYHDDKSDALMRSVWLAAEAMKGGLVVSSSRTSNNRFTHIRDANQYQMMRSRLHNITDNRRNARLARSQRWKNGIK